MGLIENWGHGRVMATQDHQQSTLKGIAIHSTCSSTLDLNLTVSMF